MPKILNSRLKGVVPDAAGKRQQVHPKNNAKEESPRQEVALYIYYDGSMRLLLLLNPQVETNEDLIESLVSFYFNITTVIGLKIDVMFYRSIFVLYLVGIRICKSNSAQAVLVQSRRTEQFLESE